MTQTQLEAYARRLVNANSTDWSADEIAVDLNDALSDVWTRIKVARGALEFDDQNASSLPYYDLNLTAGTREYKVSNDGTDDLFTVHKVQVLNSDSKWEDVPRLPVTETSQSGLNSSMSDTARVPSGYYDMYPYIVFTDYPSTSVTSGIRVWADRETTYFASGGTTFVVGIPLIYHALIAEKAALKYAVSKGLNTATNIAQLIKLGEDRVDEYEASRRADENTRLTATSIDAR